MMAGDDEVEAGLANPFGTSSQSVLKGDNYNEWETEMLNALQAKRKTSFIDGSLKKPAEDHPDPESWLSVNSIIVGWLRANTSVDVSTSAVSTRRTSRDRLLWPTCQDMGRAADLSSCTSVHVVIAIIEADVLHDLRKVYVKVICEEDRLNFAKTREQQTDALGFMTRREAPQDVLVAATNSRRDGGFGARSETSQGENTCWQIIGYAEWFTEHGGRGGRGGSNPGRGRGQVNAVQTMSVAHTTTQNPTTTMDLTLEQWRAISQLINDKAGASSDKLAGKIFG
ncbi:unnamed protein product [Microthlaspi erraticum]|uniref:Retrotransposon Copia-like N-terminal domain-containing protein n=1 Tax=Microthlaspi erraticum TaxID=1685480 RepID=A0A6D2I4U5_9BRAS|nr:unnamed protein product [Microthlaspi erraticum]